MGALKGLNRKTFKNKTGLAEDWVEEIKIMPWKWLECKVIVFNFSLSQWIVHLLVECLGSIR
jgi:hypothetical protein